jgi:sugar (pentulose or hexulose) kinase
LNIAGDKYLEPVPNHPAYPGIIPQTYNTEVMVNRGYWMVTWYKDEFGLQERLLAKEKNTTPEILLDELLRSTPPGSLGLVLQPYWGAGTSAKDT